MKPKISGMINHQNNFYVNKLLANIDDAIIATDSNFVITSWNHGAERIYGIPASAAIGTHREVLLKYEYVDSIYLKVLDTLRNTGHWKGILKFTRHDGVDVYLQSSTSAIKNDVDNVIGYVAVNRDITQQYFTEQSLHHFTEIMYSLRESFLIVDRDMRVAFLSPKKSVIEFHDSDYKVGDHALKFIPEKDISEVSGNYKKAFDGETISHEADSGGSIETRTYLHVTYLPIRNQYYHITHVAIIIKDITDEKRMAYILKKQKEMEKQLFHSRALFENFMQNCPLPAWVTDEDGVMQYMNPTYFKATGFKKEDTGKTIHELFPKQNADEFYKNNNEVLETNVSMTMTERAVDADNKTVTYLNTKFPLHYSGKNMVGGWAIDISKQVNAQTELEEANHFKTKLLSVISHDLRSPLTVTSALTSLINDDKDTFTKEELLDMLEMIGVANKKSLDLLDELRLWAQNKTNKVHCEPNEIKLQGIVYSCVHFLGETINEKSITINYKLQKDAIVYADPDMLKTIIRNLVSNATKFSPTHSTITIYSTFTDDGVTIGVCDEGTGIEEDTKKRLLKGDNNKSMYGTNGEKGIGLGLNICKDFIEAHKGALMIENNETKGCTFSFHLPARPATM